MLKVYEAMKKYKEVPQWAYALVFVVSIALSIGLGYAGPNGFVLIPAWSVILFSGEHAVMRSTIMKLTILDSHGVLLFDSNRLWYVLPVLVCAYLTEIA